MRKIEKGQIKFIVAVTALMFQSLMAFSQSNINLSLYKAGKEIALLSIDSLNKKEPVSVTVSDEEGVVLFTDQSTATAYAKMIDFGKIKSGKYFIDINQPAMAVRKVVIKDESGLTIQKDDFYLSNFISKVSKEDKKMILKVNSNLDKDVTFIIKDSQGNILHEQAGIKPSDYAALLNMSKLKSGVYNMTLMSNNLHSSRSFQID